MTIEPYLQLIVERLVIRSDHGGVSPSITELPCNAVL